VYAEGKNGQFGGLTKKNEGKKKKKKDNSPGGGRKKDAGKNARPKVIRILFLKLQVAQREVCRLRDLHAKKKGGRSAMQERIPPKFLNTFGLDLDKQGRRNPNVVEEQHRKGKRDPVGRVAQCGRQVHEMLSVNTRGNQREEGETTAIAGEKRSNVLFIRAGNQKSVRGGRAPRY